jgi:cytochrome c biogenesis protein ResB
LSVPAVKVEASGPREGQSVSGWISCGNFAVQPEFLHLDQKYILALTSPEAKEFYSRIEIIERNGKSQDVQLMVNQPIRVGGWKLYQLSYDEKRGKWSTLSIIEAIRDPWLPVIYTGILMVLAGALYLFWIGRNPKN